MKKFAALTVCLLLLSSLLAACSKSNNTSPTVSGVTATAGTTTAAAETANAKKDGPVTLSFMSWENETAMKPLLDAFKAKNPNITIDFQFTPPTKDYIQKLKTTLYTGSAADVFVIAYENKNEIMKAGYALDLSKEAFMSNLSDFNRETYSLDGKNYAYAQSAWAGGIYYNKKLFANAGVTVPKTWMEFLDVSKKLKAAGITPYLDNFTDMAANIVTGLFITETHAKNKKFDDEVNAGQKKYADGWTVPAQLWFKDLVQSGLMTKDMLGINWDQQQKEFGTEKVAMSPGGPWNVKTFLSINPNLDFGMFPYPGVDKDNTHWAGSAGIAYAVNSKTKVKDAALKLLTFMSSKEGLVLYNKGTGQMISAKGGEDIPVHASLEDAKKGLNDIWNPSAGWTNPEALRNVLQTSLQEAFAGKIKPEQIAENLDKKWAELNKK